MSTTFSLVNCMRTVSRLRAQAAILRRNKCYKEAGELENVANQYSFEIEFVATPLPSSLTREAVEYLATSCDFN